MEDYTKLFDEAVEYNQTHQQINPKNIKPLHPVNSMEFTAEEIDHYTQAGLEAIHNDQVAVLVLSGGQGSRLGYNYPKGMLKIGLPGEPTLFQLQAARMHKLKQKTWYIMTSSTTDSDVKQYFREHNYLGFSPDDIVIFKQDDLPAFTLDGDVFPNRYAPDGHGGTYHALMKNGIMSDMRRRGIKWVFLYCVDNAIVKVADPLFIGFCKENNYDVANKVIPKRSPDEKMGSFCNVNNAPHVLEYSDLTDSLKQHPALQTGNIMVHCFTVEFLERAAQMNLPHHLAYKKIPYIINDQEIKPTENNGIKLEKFLFDAFPQANNLGVLTVPRETEFTPIKNKDGPDSPHSALKQILLTCLKNLEQT